MHTETRLAADPRSAAVARHHVARALHEWGMDGYIDCAELLVSELVGNAVRHAGTEVELHVSVEYADDTLGSADQMDAVTLHLDVRDYSNRGVAFSSPSLEATGGRGLALVGALSPRWGVQPRPPHGKSIWCDVVSDQSA